MYAIRSYYGRLVVQLLEKHATDRDRMQILECGCGPGGILRKIDCNRHRVTGVDINPRCLTKARKMIGREVNWIQADIENLPFPEQTFDMIVITSYSIHYTKLYDFVGLVTNWKDPSAVVLGCHAVPTVFTDHSRQAELTGAVQRMMFFDQVGYLADDILVKLDRAAMGVSLET